jgi:hypothetical protein
VVIDVACRRPAGSTAAWSCTVTVGDDPAATTHEVTVSDGDLRRFAPGATDPTDLVRASFAFLLEREPRTSILRRFDLPIIERYFPDFPSVITARLTGSP